MIEYIYSLDTGGQFETDAVLVRKINEIIRYINDNKIENNNYISKDKIRDKIKELENQEDWYREYSSVFELEDRIRELKELLEEGK